MTEPVSWHSLPAAEALRLLDSRFSGLSAAEAAARLARDGRNEVVRRRSAPPLRLLGKQFANVFVLVLLFAAALAIGVSFTPGQGDRRVTAGFILGIVAISVTLGFFEEYRSQRELEALDRLLVAHAVVVREGAQQQIAATEVVPGDILVLSAGKKVPADARLLEAYSLRTDESALTGESLGAEKSPDPVAPDAPLAERSSMVWGSTYVTRGTGMAAVVRTGMATEVGQIAATLGQMSERPTPFQREVQRMARQITLIVAVLAALIAPFLYLVLHESLVDVALNTVSLAVATVPESLPMVLTFALALGARRMAARQAVVRRLAVVESLGSIDTICTDKTGTLTQNAMAVQRLFVNGQATALPRHAGEDAAVDELLRAGLLCNEATLDVHTAEALGDPVDRALLGAAQAAGLDVAQERAAYPRVDLIPFSSERMMMATVHDHAGHRVAYAKGAPRAILGRCSSCWHKGQVLPLEDGHCQTALAVSQQMQDEGMYMLALARKTLPPDGTAAGVEQGMTFLGLQALQDPPRPEAAEAVAQAHSAGIRVVMITGDNALTARAIARQLGLGDRVAEARELAELSREALGKRLQELDIVARAAPQTKQQVLQALQDAGHFVAMTGDGVNDATALKQADVGVAMGQGTDIAKGAASMVLLDDNFATIVAAIREGRRIFDNIRKFTNYLLSTTMGAVFVVLTLSAAGHFPLSPQMLLWVNVVTDLVPASALAADPAVPRVMARRPRRHDEPLLNKAIYATIAGSVLRTLVAYSLIYWVGLLWGGERYARTMLFTSIVLHAFTRVMVVRQLDELSLRSNRALLLSYAAAVGLQLLALYTPLRDVFGVVPLDWRAWAVMVPVTAGSSLAGVYMTRWILKRVPL